MTQTKPDERVRGINIDAPCICGNEATCVGNYEGAGISLGCDGCCGHGNEDGWCIPVDDERQARALVKARAEGYAQAREQAAGLFDADAATAPGTMFARVSEENAERIRAMQPDGET